MPLSTRRHVDTSGTLHGTSRFRLCAKVERAKTLSQSSWYEDDVLILGRSFRPSPLPLAAGFVVRAYAAKIRTRTRAMYGVTV